MLVAVVLFLLPQEKIHFQSARASTRKISFGVEQGSKYQIIGRVESN